MSISRMFRGGIENPSSFPEPIEFAYYAIHNCFRRHALGEQIDPWLIVNQALASIDDEGSWSLRLRAAVAAAG